MVLNLLFKFTILLSFSLFAYAGRYKGECKELSNLLDNVSTEEQDIGLPDCDLNEEGKIISIEVGADGFMSQDAIDIIANYTSIETIKFNYVDFPEDLNMENLMVDTVQFYNLKKGAKVHKFKGEEFSKTVLSTLKNVNKIILTGYITTQNIVDDLSTLNNLSELHFASSSFEEGLNFSNLKNIKALTSLNFGTYSGKEKKFGKFPESLCDFKNLKKLSLCNQDISEIPKCINSLKNLEYLNLNSNLIQKLPRTFSDLTELTYLSLNNNDISTIPAQIGDLEKLITLYLNNNKITKISNAIYYHEKLQVLDLSYNNISSIPRSIENLENLVELNLQDNSISTIPNNFGNLKKLEIFNIRYNQLTSIPSCVLKISSLVNLYMGNNKITSIPDAIGNLINLEELTLDNNAITNMPEAIGKLEKLVKLNLSFNQIDATIPESLNDLTNLKYIYLSNNVDIRGKTLTNPSLFICSYNVRYNKSNDFCLAENTKCDDGSQIEPCESA